MEIPSSTAGVVKELKVKLGDKVKEGSVVLLLEAAGAAAAAPRAVPVASAAGRCGACGLSAAAAATRACGQLARGPIDGGMCPTSATSRTSR